MSPKATGLRRAEAASAAQAGEGLPPSPALPPTPHPPASRAPSPDGRRGYAPVLVALLLALCSVASSSHSALAEEAILRFASDLTLARDGNLHVVETIRVRSEGREIRRGIFRDVSTTFEDAEGNVRRVGFELLGVTRDGEPEPYFTETYSDYIRIYAGSADTFLPNGEYTYVLTYETDRQVRWFEGKPELYWNVTGNEWAFPIEAATANVRLPGRRPAGAMDRLHRTSSASAARISAARSTATARSRCARRGGCNPMKG